PFHVLGGRPVFGVFGSDPWDHRVIIVPWFADRFAEGCLAHGAAPCRGPWRPVFGAPPRPIRRTPPRRSGNVRYLARPPRRELQFFLRSQSRDRDRRGLRALRLWREPRRARCDRTPLLPLPTRLRRSHRPQ